MEANILNMAESEAKDYVNTNLHKIIKELYQKISTLEIKNNEISAQLSHEINNFKALQVENEKIIENQKNQLDKQNQDMEKLQLTLSQVSITNQNKTVYIGPASEFRPKFKGYIPTDTEKLQEISNSLKPNDIIYMNLNDYNSSNSAERLGFSDSYKGKEELDNFLEKTTEFATTAGKIYFDYTNKQLEESHCKILETLQQKYPNHSFSYVDATITFEKDGGSYKDLDAQIFQLHSSKRVYLNFNHSFETNAEGEKKIRKALKCLTNVTRANLDFSFAKLNKEFAIEILQVLQNFKTISCLQLNFCANDKIGKATAVEIANLLRSSLNISCLDLNIGETSVGKEGCIEIVEAVKILPNITHLALNFNLNKIDDNAARIIANTLISFECLKNGSISVLILFMGRNEIGNTGAMEFASALKNFKNLDRVYANFLNNKNITVAGKKSLDELKSIPAFKIVGSK